MQYALHCLTTRVCDMCDRGYAANAAAGGQPLVSAQQMPGVVGMPPMQGTFAFIDHFGPLFD